jgi:hypothetical protein
MSSSPPRRLAAHADETAGWATHAEQLAAWCRERYFLRDDRYGGYIERRSVADDPSTASVRPATMPRYGAEPGALKDDVLLAHFLKPGCYWHRIEGEKDTDGKPFAVAGLLTTCGAHVSSPDDRCIWSRMAELDAHCEETKAADAKRNWSAAMHWGGERLCEDWGFNPLLWDSNQGGGLWLDVMYAEPLPSELAHELCLHLTADWSKLGFDSRPESFPKQPRVSDTEGKCGSWARLPGVHYKRRCWSRLWDWEGKRWLTGADAAKALLAHVPTPLSAVERLLSRTDLLVIAPLKPGGEGSKSEPEPEPKPERAEPERTGPERAERSRVGEGMRARRHGRNGSESTPLPSPRAARVGGETTTPTGSRTSGSVTTACPTTLFAKSSPNTTSGTVRRCRRT